MKIGIIGGGNIGSTLTRRLTALGHEVSVANSRGPQTLAALAQETGAHAVTVPEAVQGAQLVVVTIPEKNIPQLPSDLFEGVPADVVVVDTGNYYPRHRDGRIAAIEEESSQRGACRFSPRGPGRRSGLCDLLRQIQNDALRPAHIA